MEQRVIEVFSHQYRVLRINCSTISIKSDEAYELISPIIYIYRHATELFLKATIGPRIGHDLGKLLEELKSLLEEKFPEFDTKLPSEFEDTIRVFSDFDRRGTAYKRKDSFW